ncbi:hypothetical protein [Thermanaeromonas sp. C210]|uniref:hypothetical protein n=1 Tax=Thermanaeromonas sp. C210 TaxID=2731925 RepID=UPI0015647080|nr:hypothetical protein [Thermanaeromonas sp. C210]
MLLRILPQVKKLIDFQELTGLPLLPELKNFYSTAIDYLQNPYHYDFLSVTYYAEELNCSTDSSSNSKK